MSQITIFDELRDGFAYIADKAEHVSVNERALKEYASEIASLPIPDTYDDTHHYVSGELEWDLGYVLLLDSVNFGSAYYDALLKEGTLNEGGSFYFSMASRLKQRFMDDPITVAQAANLTQQDVCKIFGFRDALKSQELATLYHEALVEMAQAVRAHGANYMSYIDAMDGKASNAVEMLARQSKFKDEAIYKDQNVKFYKRAQITVADLHLSAKNSGMTLFKDVDQFTLFADNAVPHVLETDGVLMYSPELKQRVVNGQIIQHGSPEECEIRGCAAYAVGLIAKEADMTAMDVDHRLWHRSEGGSEEGSEEGNEAQDYNLSYAHKTPCVYY